MAITLAVCGDSWFSTDPTHPGRSFSEVICRRNDWQLIQLARGGVSNFVVGLQVDKAIECDADIIIVGTTTSDRIQVPLENHTNASSWPKLRQSLAFWEDYQLRSYIKANGLSNIVYPEHLTDAIKNWKDKPTLYSCSLTGLIPPLFDRSLLSKNQSEAVRSYMMYLHDTHAQKQIDAWIISDACRRLYAAKKSFIIFIEALYQNDFSQDIDWLDPKNVIKPADLAIWDLPRTSKTGFHYNLDAANSIVDVLEPRLIALLKEKDTHA